MGYEKEDIFCCLFFIMKTVENVLSDFNTPRGVVLTGLSQVMEVGRGGIEEYSIEIQVVYF